MGPSEADVRLAVGTLEDPDLRRGLAELGMVGAVEVGRRADRRRDPGAGAGMAERQGSGGPGPTPSSAPHGHGGAWPEPHVDLRVMTDDERAELLRRLAAPPGGEPVTAASPPVREAAACSGGDRLVRSVTKRAGPTAS